jgi:predicted dithiol-disulfide oxidoreductase (DUF899 family)
VGSHHTSTHRHPFPDAGSDVTLTAVSRAPFAKIDAYRKRMGWSFPWVSSYGSDFYFDYHATFTPEEIATGKG